MKQNGQAEWLDRMCEKVINAVRANKGLPSMDTEGYLSVTIPTLHEQAYNLNSAEDDVYEILKTGVPSLA